MISPTGVPLALVAGAVMGLGVFCLVLVFTGVPERDPSKPPLLFKNRDSWSAETLRLVTGAGIGVLTLVLTRWIVAAVGVGLLAAYWDRVVGDARGESASIARLEALASWTESLRDTIAGAIGLEQAIPATAANAGASIRPSLNLLVDRLRIRETLPDALLAFAEDVDDPSADVICSALVLNARLRGPGLRDVLTALAISTREELDMRRRIEASRRATRRSVRIVVVIVLTMVFGMAVLNHDYVTSYDSIEGQAVLLVVALLFLGGLLWLRRLGTPAPVGRFLVVDTRDRGQAMEEAGL